MLKRILHKLTDTSDGGKHLPWITRRIMAFVQGYDHEKYWTRRAKVVDPSYKNVLLKVYYLWYIKRVDNKHHCSFGTSYNWGAYFCTPPYLPHGPNGIIVGHDAKIGSECCIYHQVTIPAGNVVVGDKVTFFPGAKVIEGIKIGNNCRIGANVVVCEDIPDNAMVVPQKARIIQPKK